MRFVFVLICIVMYPAFPAEYLPVCEKCLNPRIHSKSGARTSSASADAKVVQEDAVTWCATNRPRDPYCAREEVTNGGDGGRKSYKATADCSAGILNSIDGYEYRYVGVWPDGPGRGRPMLKGAAGNIPRWNSIVSGRGVARAEWAKFGGYSLAGQWEVLCGTVPPASAQSAQTKPVESEGEWLASCFRCPAPAVTSKTGIGTANAVADARFSATEIKSSCAETDPQNVAACVRREMAERGNKTYRATADCTGGRITTIDDQHYTLAGIWDNSDIGGGRTKWRGADGQIVGRDNASGGLAISQQWEVLCPGPVSNALLSSAATVPGRPAVPAQVATATTSASACAGKRYCEESNTFAAIIRDFRSSTLPDSTRMVSATIKFLNKTNRPLLLGYIRSSGVAIDDQGNRYILPTPTNVRGMGEIGGREFDPKFTLQPGQSADTRFEFVWRWNGRDIIGHKAWDIELAVREPNEAAPGQYRFGAEHALQFRGVPSATAAVSQSVPAATAPTASATDPRRTDACEGKTRCFDAGAFVTEIGSGTLTREGTYQDRVARLNLLIRNMGDQPLPLAYVAKSSVLTDNLGRRFFWGTAGTYDTSATGIGKVEANRADPQFTLAPGESRTVTFTLRRRTPKTDPDGTSYTFNVALAQLEVINPQQVRTTREHSLAFTDFALNATAAAPSGTPANSGQQTIRDLSNAIRGLGKKK
ncbi:MAG TPA: hypothetical protein VEX68_26495 [Bryobacteraceae bacterium]|nr:hypothetical protein [Bryobacteraceae bacterium]